MSGKKKVFARIAFQDQLMSIEDYENSAQVETDLSEAYFVCFEDENGNECDKNGN